MTDIIDLDKKRAENKQETDPEAEARIQVGIEAAERRRKRQEQLRKKQNNALRSTLLR